MKRKEFDGFSLMKKFKRARCYIIEIISSFSEDKKNYSISVTTIWMHISSSNERNKKNLPKIYYN